MNINWHPVRKLLAGHRKSLLCSFQGALRSTRYWRHCTFLDRPVSYAELLLRYELQLTQLLRLPPRAMSTEHRPVLPLHHGRFRRRGITR
jgi:hypothetical protein